jgi:alpha-ketoglutarate-dependent taurine dioxygenase
MPTIGPAPERLTPLINTHPNFEPELLFKSETATLELEGKTFSGTVEIKHYWESNNSQIEF